MPQQSQPTLLEYLLREYPPNLRTGEVEAALTYMQAQLDKNPPNSTTIDANGLLLRMGNGDAVVIGAIPQMAEVPRPPVVQITNRPGKGQAGSAYTPVVARPPQ